MGTGEIVRVVRAGRPELAQELRARREHSVKEARDDLRGRLRQLSDAIDSGRRNGLLNEDGWALLRARSDDLADPDLLSAAHNAEIEETKRSVPADRCGSGSCASIRFAAD